MGYYNECSMDDPNAELFSYEGWSVDERRAPAPQPPTTERGRFAANARLLAAAPDLLTALDDERKAGMSTTRDQIEQEILARWYADGAEVSLRRVIDRLATAETREHALRSASSQALTYIEDGAPQTAAIRLRAALAAVTT